MHTYSAVFLIRVFRGGVGDVRGVFCGVFRGGVGVFRSSRFRRGVDRRFPLTGWQTGWHRDKSAGTRCLSLGCMGLVAAFFFF